MSESQAIQSIMNAELEVYRQKGRVLELEANNAALRLKVQALEEWKRIVTGAGTDQESVIRLAAIEYTKTAVQCWKDANAKLQYRLTTLETLVKALPKINGTIFETVASCRGEGGPESWVRFEVALAALLTHRQGMGG